jgi:hypothetical protein
VSASVDHGIAGGDPNQTAPAVGKKAKWESEENINTRILSDDAVEACRRKPYVQLRLQD